MTGIELVVNAGCVIGEGPIYDADSRVLYWIDLIGNKIFSYDLLNARLTSLDLDQNIGCIALRQNGGMVAAMQNGFYFIDFKTGKLEQIANPEAEKTNNRFNDGKCDCMGRLWAGTMSKDLDTGYGYYKPEGSLYCLYPDLHVERKIKEVTLSNGIGWSPDNQTAYYIDTPTMTVAAFDFDSESGEIKNKRTAIKIPGNMGIPDGMCVDLEGMIWVALWGGFAVTRWDPKTGGLLEKIKVPAPNVSSCTFGGENFDELFITTASIGTDLSKYPDAGGLFRVHPEVAGIETYVYKG